MVKCLVKNDCSLTALEKVDVFYLLARVLVLQSLIGALQCCKKQGQFEEEDLGGKLAVVSETAIAVISKLETNSATRIISETPTIVIPTIVIPKTIIITIVIPIVIPITTPTATAIPVISVSTTSAASPSSIISRFFWRCS